MRFTTGTLRQHSWRLAVTLVAAGWLFPVNVSAQEPVDVGKLVEETQQQLLASDRVTIVWWLPEEFWRAVTVAQGSLTESGLEELLGVVRPYLLVAVLDAKTGPFGGAEFESEEVVREALRVVDADGVEYKPLPQAEISTDLKNLLTAMQPIMASLMGPMGENLRFYVFPAQSREGTSIAAASQPGSFTVKLADRVFKWHLPLGSLLPPRICPVDGERLDGSWEYCPWHGKKLEAPEAPAPREQD